MKLLRVAFVGAVVLLGATCDVFSSSTEDTVTSGDADKGELGWDAHRGENEEAKPMTTSFAHEWAMTPANFALHVGGHGFCLNTLERPSVDASSADEPSNSDEKDDVELCGKLTSEGDLPSVCSADRASEANTPSGTFEGASADASSVDGRSNGDDDDDDEFDDAIDDDIDIDASGDKTATHTFESILRLRKTAWVDSTMRVLLTPGSDVEPAMIQMTEVKPGLLSQGKPITKIVRLTPGTEVHAVSLDAFTVSQYEGTWTLIARNRVQRDMWIAALVEITGQTDDNRFDVLEFKTGQDMNLKRGLVMQPRTLALAGSVLTMCKLTKDGRGTKSCEELHLNRNSDAVPVKSRKGKKGAGTTTRALFKVTTGPSRSANFKTWTFDAGSTKEQARWIAAVKDVVGQAKSNEDDIPKEDDEAEESLDERFIDPRSRGSKLAPGDKPLIIGTYLSSSSNSQNRKGKNKEEPSATLEVNWIGDVIVRAGNVPDKTQEPLWAYRVTHTFQGRANGGLMCVLEEKWQRLTGQEVTPVNLKVKNGRWRVGRGAMCTHGRSAAPEGSLRRFLPWDQRGREIKEAELHLEQDGRVVIKSGDTVLWDSSEYY